MSVLTQAIEVEYTSDGAQLAFAVPFPFLDADDLVVEVDNTAVPPVTTVLTKTTHYTVTGGQPSSGSITLVAAFAINYVVRIRRVMVIEQANVLRSQGTFLPGVHEAMFDRLTMLLQQLQAGVVVADPLSVGEVNLVANIGSGGVGLYKEKNGVTFRFRNIGVGSDSLTVTLNAGANQVDLDLAEKHKAVHGTYTWNAGTSVWDRSDHVGDLPLVGSRTAQGKCKLTFAVPYGSTKYGCAVTLRTSSGSSGYAPRILKNVAYVEVWLYEGAAIADDVDFDIVITPNLA